MIIKISLLMVMIVALISFTGCDEETPDRDRIPQLKDALYKLQVAVKSTEISAIDSLLSSDIDDYEQSSDSLLSFVSRDATGFEFVQFGKAEMFYTKTLARIDCFIIGSIPEEEIAVTLTFKLDDERWLLKHFELGHQSMIPVETE